jgi:hypothetical protein
LPHKDPEDKKRYFKEWRERQPKAYGAWLYKRRKTYTEDAAHFRQALEEIAATTSERGTRSIANDALADSNDRWEKLAAERKELF